MAMLMQVLAQNSLSKCPISTLVRRASSDPTQTQKLRVAPETLRQAQTDPADDLCQYGPLAGLIQEPRVTSNGAWSVHGAGAEAEHHDHIHSCGLEWAKRGSKPKIFFCL